MPPYASISLRPVVPGDDPFLEELTLAVREGEPGFRDLAPAVRTRLLRDQHLFQQTTYRAQFPQAYFMIVEVQGVPAGRFTVAHLPGEIRVVDLALLPAWQGRGIGGALIRRVQGEAQRTGAAVRLHHIIASPAGEFYRRLGFLPLGSTGTHCLVEWRAGA